MMRNELQRLPYSKQHERQRILNKLIDFIIFKCLFVKNKNLKKAQFHQFSRNVSQMRCFIQLLAVRSQVFTIMEKIKHQILKLTNNVNN